MKKHRKLHYIPLYTDGYLLAKENDDKDYQMLNE